MSRPNLLYASAVVIVAFTFSMWIHINIKGSPLAPVWIAPLVSGIVAAMCSRWLERVHAAPVFLSILTGLIVSWSMLSAGVLSGIISGYVSDSPGSLTANDVVLILQTGFLTVPFVLIISVGLLPAVAICFLSVFFTLYIKRQ